MKKSGYEEKLFYQKVKKISFFNSLGQRIVGIVEGAEFNKPSRGIILCHGMESTKDGVKHQALARCLSEKGFIVLRFDFSFCGESGGLYDNITYSQEVDDLKSAVNFFLNSYPISWLGIVGSSMGASVAILYVSEDPRIKALVSLAAPAYPGRNIFKFFSEGGVKKWKGDGYVFLNGSRINYSFLDDAMKLDIIGAIKCIKCPMLIIHGEKDELVDVQDALDLYDSAPLDSRLFIAKGADHRFSDNEKRESVLRLIVEWLEERGRD